jgi:methyl-accepting chemotaxis protein
MFDRLKKLFRLPVKLGLLIALLLIPLAVLVYDFTRTSETNIRFAEKEILGVEYLRPLRRLLEDVAAHRDQPVLAPGAGPLAAARAVDTDLQALAEVDRRLGRELGTADLVPALAKGWEELRDQAAQGRLSAPARFAGHGALLNQVYALIRHVGDSSNLILDPDLDSYYLMEAVVVSLPEALQSVGQLRVLGVEAARRGSATAPERAQLGQLADGERRRVQGLQRGFAVALQTRPALQAPVGKPAQEAFDALDELLGAAGRQIVAAPEPLTLAPVRFQETGTRAHDRLFSLYDRSLESLRGLLVARAGRLTGERNRRLLLSGILTLLALLSTLLIVRGIARQVGAISRTLGELGTGNVGVRAQVLSSDELGATAASLNAMLDNIRGLMQSREERDRIQASVMKLLNEVSDVAEGDLRVSAEVGPDITGAIADSFNYMIIELRQIIESVKSTSAEVSAAAGGVRSTAERLADGSTGQAIEIDQTSARMEQMAGAMQQATEQSLAAARVAEQALDKARQGTASVTRTIEGMTAIRGQVQETAKRIKRLGESSQEISEIVQVIGDIADRTSILALNATIQAASAGDAGRGFMVVAEEVERLAQRAAASSKSIETLVRTIQSETHEAVAAMDGMTREVVGGSGLALAAGRSLQEIEDVSVRLAELIRSIAETTNHQASDTHEASRTMGRLSELTNETAASARNAATSIRGLAVLADQLRASMERFKLPEKAA